MSKYIIEIEDEPFGRNDDPNIPHGMDELYRAKGFNSLVFDQFGLDKLTPLDKALDEAYLQGRHDAEQDLARASYEEAYQKGYEVGSHEATTLEYQQGLDDAWEAARTIVRNTSLNDWKSVGVDIGEWDGDESEALNRYSVSEVIEILKKMGKPNPDEIKVGDEVEAYSGRAIVFGTFTDTKGNKFCRYWYPSDDSFNKDKTENLKRTGRNFPQVAELLEAMKEGAE